MTKLLDLLQGFRQQIGDPLLSLPDPHVVRRRLFSGKRLATRASKRIAAKRRGISPSVVKKAQRLLMEKLGLCREQQRLSAEQLADYAAMFASPLGKEHVAALTALFGLSCPDVDEAGMVAMTEA
jgi:hypothetical protein